MPRLSGGSDVVTSFRLLLVAIHDKFQRLMVFHAWYFPGVCITRYACQVLNFVCLQSSVLVDGILVQLKYLRLVGG